LFKNKNALNSTYIGNDVMTAGSTPFVVAVAHLETDPNTESNGLPTFAASIAGITDEN